MKCVSIDLDGTLLDTKHQISKENEVVISQLKEKGIEVILNTGRAYKDVVKIPEVQDLNCPIFCLNGSMMYAPTGELLYETNLSFALYNRLIKTLQHLNVGILVYTNQGGFPATLPNLRGKTNEEIQEMFDRTDYVHIPHIENIKIYKLIAWVPNEQKDTIQLVRESVKNEESISFSSSFPNNLEITSVEAQKGKAIRRYEEIKQVSFDEIYSFGDGGNDVSQFEVSTVSFAMENAPDEIKQKATNTTKSNDEDGVAHAIKHILKLV
ncbi:HAD family hydrolase [Bacillus sp. 03113]|uniref:HAD family hydrolase n=1 Tax=Bacillus sp. 03113 TaxID=2578211 RepID=UPI001141A06C|nr:HAD family hydrolase [Bacillus sp. 03113]